MRTKINDIQPDSFADMYQKSISNKQNLLQIQLQNESEKQTQTEQTDWNNATIPYKSLIPKYFPSDPSSKTSIKSEPHKLTATQACFLALFEKFNISDDHTEQSLIINDINKVGKLDEEAKKTKEAAQRREGNRQKARIQIEQIQREIDGSNQEIQNRKQMMEKLQEEVREAELEED